MKITSEGVDHVAHLAMLNLREDEKDKFTAQLNDVFLYMEMLNKVDTAGVEPMTHAISLNNAFRDDAVKESIGDEKALANAPDKMGNCFRVPKVIE
ncbi:MAG: Asp-tRNA(Asn)/Glu-tRNA(Gln) amidotransferase subunit GatC [Syntrophobacterales bacterium]|nr:Asp-tRNA(Asn)/Glu-tRNA(Gln) amidotransferase subunit GatC [Syntrophobacterales bacterium]